MQQKQHIWPNMPYAPYIGVSGGGCEYHWRQRPVVNYRKALSLWGRRLRAHRDAKRVENGVYAIQKWVPFTPKCSQTRWRPQTHHYSEGITPFALASLTRQVENSVNAIQKWLPFTPKCSQKRRRLGLRPRPPIARENAFDACQSDTRGEGAPLPISAPGAINPRYATVCLWMWF